MFGKINLLYPLWDLACKISLVFPNMYVKMTLTADYFFLALYFFHELRKNELFDFFYTRNEYSFHDQNQRIFRRWRGRYPVCRLKAFVKWLRLE